MSIIIIASYSVLPSKILVVNIIILYVGTKYFIEVSVLQRLKIISSFELVLHNME